MEAQKKRKYQKRFEPVLVRVQELLAGEEPIILVGIDGKCGSGKTTLGEYLHEELGGNLFHMDDFFLQDYQRTEERLAEVGGNVDYERFAREVIAPVVKGQEVEYVRFDCGRRTLLDGKRVEKARLNIVEGSYSLHPCFKDVYQLRVFVDVEEAVQLERIRKRSGEEMLRRFQEEWIPKEEAYFKKFAIRDGGMVV